MKTRTEIIAAEGFTLSRLVWRLLGRQPAGYIETVLATNPHLAALGPLLPIGTRVVFPIDEIPADEPKANVVRLWD